MTCMIGNYLLELYNCIFEFNSAYCLALEMEEFINNILLT